MKRSSWMILGMAALILVGLAYHKLSAPPPPDEEQIRALLVRGESAIERRNIQSALSCISKDYSDPTGFNRDGLRLQIVEAFRSADGYDVALQTGRIQIDGDSAEVETEVTMAAFREGHRHEVFSGLVTIKMEKDSAKRYLLLPTKAWKVTGMGGLPMSPEML